MLEGPISQATRSRHSEELGGEWVIDASAIESLQEIAGEDAVEFLVEVIDLFLEDSAAQLGDLRHAAENGDRSEAARKAHTLKSASANVGAVALSASCEVVESAVREERELDLDQQVARISGMFEEAGQVLSRLKAGLQTRTS